MKQRRGIEERAPLRIAVLASGGGTTFEAIAREFKGSRHVEPVLVITNNPEAGVIGRAEKLGVKVVKVPAVKHEQQIIDALGEAKPDLVVLAGWLRMIGPRLLNAYGGRIINTHPALLGKNPRGKEVERGGKGMYGDKVHARVLQDFKQGRLSHSGATVHFVDNNYDTGEHIAQVVVPLEPDDTVESLRKRVQKAEKKLLINAIWNFALKRGAGK